MNAVAAVAARMIIGHPVALVAATMLAAFTLSWGIPRLEFHTGQDTLIGRDSKVAQDNERFQRQFGGDPMLVLFEAPEGGDVTALFSEANREAIAALERELAATGNYQSILTPLLIVEYAQAQIARRMREEPARLAAEQDAAAIEARAAAAARGASPEEQDAAAAEARQEVADAFNAAFGADARRFVEVGERSLDNPRFVEFVLYGADGEIRADLGDIFPTERHALMIVRPNGNLSIDEGAMVAADVVTVAEDYEFDGFSTVVSGPPMLIKEINDQMRQSLLVMAIFAVVIMVAVLSLIFRARWRLLSLPAVLVGSVSAFGLMGFLGIPLTMVTISGLPILIGLGVDFAIQAHSRLEEETFATDSAEAGVERTAAFLGPALAIALVAACIGFAVLHLSDVPMIRDFGTMLAIGAVIVFVVSIALISGTIYLRERTRIGAEQPRARIEVERVVHSVTSRTVGRLAPIAVAAVAIATAGLYAGTRIGTETAPESFVPSGSAVLKDLFYVRDITGSTSEVNLLIETAGDRRVTDDDVLAWMLAYERGQQERHPELGTSNSVASFVQRASGRAPTADDAELVLAEAPAALVDTVVSADRRTASITFAISGEQSLAERKALTRSLESGADLPPGVSIAPAGIAVVGTASVDALSANRDLMSFVAICAIAVALFALYRSPLKAVAPLLPVVLALGASAMIIYVSGMQYSPLTSISGPLIIAMGTEFNILLMSRYYEERARGLSAREAMSTASLRIGRAIAASGVTVMGGFAVLALSDFPLLDNFGKVTALNIGISLISTVVLLPPLLVWADADRGVTSADATAAAQS
jgi:hypothetical protein